MKRTLLGLIAGLFLLAGCASVEVGDYRAEKPALDLRQYFNGRLDAWGMFQDRSGKVIKRFHVAMRASWQGEVGTLDEDFTYSDGTKQKRIWTLTRQPDGSYIGRADDVVGEARGELAGNALRWRYVLALPVDGKVYNVNFDDWMYLIDDKVMLNRSFMSKFGFELGQVTLSFTKQD
ncbi:DUF3833 domain-containing protein [Uliginosibacterium sp. TH139]|uniref:DUF3833 domain-containing protein n=1 Tax=Uliginosibacterium sp. TH139 TaxID=2067453 RepID=UPI000C7E22FF|nr:DUF3833 domain-containing protein [Uliginosibacterium sp. TH139]PLK47076.1 DUF3833 domain-containing protein [Uliginosibacterium sp. TH139]